jgi:multiple antibiotic resistance protein
MPASLVELFRTSLLIVGALFPIVNPLGNAPIFLMLPPGFSSGMRTVLARKIAMNGFVLLLGSILIGTNILAFFGISLPVVQVGGGLVVIATAWNLLTGGGGYRAADASDHPPTAADLSSRAFYPLTLPLTVGPGSILVAITVGANRPEGAQAHWWIWAALLIGSAVIAISIFLCYRFAETLARALGPTAMNVVIRLSSFILLCIGVQIAWNGVSTLLHSVLIPGR